MLQVQRANEKLYALMTVSTSSMSLLSQEQIPRAVVESSKGQSASVADVEARSLAAAIARGDEAAFRALYERYHARLFRFTLVLSRGDELLAQDTVQLVFLTAAKKLRQADGEEHLWNWLARVARQQLAKAWKKHRREASFLNAEELAGDYPATAAPDSFLEEVLDGALQMLEAEERQLVQNFYFSRLSQKELAEQLGTTPKAISSRLERAREKLRSIIRRRLLHET
jgi:RNA polymerase sigma-70 factor (ECF subfamily)